MRRDEPDVREVVGSAPLPAAPRVIIDALTPLVTPARRARIENVVKQRTTHIVGVFEELADPHNVSAVLRSADAFGVQEIHVLPGRHGFLASERVAKGSERWLTVVYETDPRACVNALRARGYTVLAAAMNGRLGPDDLRNIPRVAVVFGNEHRGVSEAFHSVVDDTYAIPMCGFVESLNVSVAAAITFFEASKNVRSMTDDEQEELTARFLLGSVRDADRVVAQYASARPHD